MFIFRNFLSNLYCSLFLFFKALRSSGFLINLEPLSFVFGKFNAKSFVLTLKILKFDKKVISRSVFSSSIANFSNLNSFDVDNLIYFCTMSYITFPNVLCNIKHAIDLKLNIFINSASSLQFATGFVITYHIFKRIYNKTMKYW